MPVTLAIVLVWMVLAFRMSQRFLQYFQIEEYDNARFLRWFFANLRLLVDRLLLAVPAVLAVLSLVLVLTGPPAQEAVLAEAVAWVVAGAYLVVAKWRRSTPAKKPLVYTARAKRILGTAFLLQLVPPIAAVFAFAGGSGAWPGAGSVLAVGVLSAATALLAPIALVLANLLLYPVEGLLRQRYIGMARARLRSQTRNTTIIGITGSYGKTSTKDILTHILGTRYRVSKTPKSFNTLMGICKSINDGDLRPGDDYFVAELGAYIPGEIRRLAQLLKPKVGVLTAVGPQHLERFKTIENVARAKYELIEALPADGLAVFNADNDICYRLARGTHHVPVALYGIEKHPDEVYLRAEDIRITREGLRFTIVRPPTGEKVAVRTRLLGRHQVSNILAASTVALWAGLTLNDIAAAIAMIQPTPHRLELKQGAGGITVLDDAYNSNPEGARNALEILSEFRDGKRILVTPGLVELGELEPVENRRLGSHAAGACDIAILVGCGRTDYIRQGLEESGFPAHNVIQVPTLTEAIARLRTIASPGDTVLLLNDLPDTYELITG